MDISRPEDEPAAAKPATDAPAEPAPSEPALTASAQSDPAAAEAAPSEPAPEEGGSTLVEFWLSELADGATLVRVVESGFASLPGTDEDRGQAYDGNTEGWRQQLDIFKSRAEHVAI
jgi:hypothetical protein